MGGVFYSYASPLSSVSYQYTDRTKFTKEKEESRFCPVNIINISIEIFGNFVNRFSLFERINFCYNDRVGKGLPVWTAAQIQKMENKICYISEIIQPPPKGMQKWHSR